MKDTCKTRTLPLIQFSCCIYSCRKHVFSAGFGLAAIISYIDGLQQKRIEQLRWTGICTISIYKLINEIESTGHTSTSVDSKLNAALNNQRACMSAAQALFYRIMPTVFQQYSYLFCCCNFNNPPWDFAAGKLITRKRSFYKKLSSHTIEPTHLGNVFHVFLRITFLDCVRSYISISISWAQVLL